MQGLPHDYRAEASTSGSAHVSTRCPGQPELTIAPPSNFGGPGDIHSPEDLQVAAIASCFILSFRAIAAASKLDWQRIEVHASGTLDQQDRAVLFTGFFLDVTLALEDAAHADKAQRLLDKAKQSCFITNSLKAETTMSVSIT
ncbi:MAG: OsmC family protein [Halieaceae bacterium]|jgi:organic hydroperoxide reductase OsmC/OhrA|nr:OsmC family protein [Halieaceae bacterium]